MAFKTLRNLMLGVEAKVGLVSGTAVQTYSEPQIKSAVQDASTFLFRKRFWEHLSEWSPYTLDGSAGVVTTDLTNVLKSYTDLKEAFYMNAGVSNGPRIVKPQGRQHLVATGSVPLFYTPIKATDANFLTRVIRFWPNNAVGTVMLYIRTEPAPYASDDLVPFPSDLMEWAAAWLMLETDGVNPGNANKCQAMYTMSYNDYVASISEDVIGHGPNRGQPDWSWA